MYKIYLDKNELFECDLSVKNASLKNSVARIIMESEDGINYAFNGKIDGQKCVIPIKRLKGLLDENSRGNMFLEVIVEDTYFKPWKDNFIVEEHTSVKVKINEEKHSSKPIVKLKNSMEEQSKNNKSENDAYIPLYELSNICEKFDINRSNISEKKSQFNQILNEYFKLNPEFKPCKSVILEGLKHVIK